MLQILKWLCREEIKRSYSYWTIYFRYHMISISFFILQSKAVWDSVLQYEIALWGKLISHSLWRHNNPIVTSYIPYFEIAGSPLRDWQLNLSNQNAPFTHAVCSYRRHAILPGSLQLSDIDITDAMVLLGHM